MKGTWCKPSTHATPAPARIDSHEITQHVPGNNKAHLGAVLTLQPTPGPFIAGRAPTPDVVRHEWSLVCTACHVAHAGPGTGPGFKTSMHRKGVPSLVVIKTEPSRAEGRVRGTEPQAGRLGRAPPPRPLRSAHVTLAPPV